MQNKKKIINDPLYGFITIPSDLIFDVISHPYFQRLRRIKQLGLTELVYPGANHSRFQHALGAMHLTTLALETLLAKGIEISEKEKEGVLLAILLHDIGHGPFSHVLENEILTTVHHEEVTLLLLHKLNQIFDNKLEVAIQIFEGSYPRAFFHQLVSSQLDMDRMDYLNRDCFFTGVVEGTIGVDRIIKLLDVYQDELVVDNKGLLSVENFLNARRLMYWQVYLHKTSIAAESLLISILNRAKDLLLSGFQLHSSPTLLYFLRNKISFTDLAEDEVSIEQFIQLDDFDIMGSIKAWSNSEDQILSQLCTFFLNRNLFKIRLGKEQISEAQLTEIKENLLEIGIEPKNLPYYLRTGKVSNKAYIAENENINILLKNKIVQDISEASDLPNIKALTHIVEKNYIAWVNPSSI